METLVSTIAGEGISRLIDWAAAGIIRHRQQRKISKLLDEAQMRAAALGLSNQFNNATLVNELVSNLALKRKSATESVSIFLGPDREWNASQKDFVKELCDEIDEVLSPAEDSLASTRALRISEEAKEGIQKLLDIEKTGDKNGAMGLVLLEEIIPFIQSGEIDVDHLGQLTKSIEGSVVSLYLRAYLSLCNGEEPDFAWISKLSGYDNACIALASVAVSAGQYDAAVEALKNCSFESAEVIAAIRQISESSGKIQKQIVLTVAVPAYVEPFINLLSFNTSFCSNAFQAAARYSDAADIAWNPIALEERYISALISSSVINDSNLYVLTREVINRFRPWFASSLVAQLKHALSLSFLCLPINLAQELILELPESLNSFAEDEKYALKLRECSSIREAIHILTWAEARRNPTLMMDAALRVIKLDEGERPNVIEAFERCSGWVFTNVGMLRMYVYEINPDISYEKYCSLGKAMNQDVTFNLIAYELFHDVTPDKSISHIERAISAMKEPLGNTDLLSSHIWVPYLYERRRVEEIEQIARDILPIAPLDYVASFFQALASCSNTRDTIDGLAKSMALSEFWDSRVAELVVKHFVSCGQLDVAGPLARSFFKVLRTETLAEVAIEWACSACVDPGHDLIDYLRGVDSTRGNMALARYYGETGNSEERDALLVRAAFGEGGGTGCALITYAMEHAGIDEGDDGATRIGRDCFAVLSTDDGQERTVLFFSNPIAVKYDGISCSVGEAFSVRSKEYMNLMQRGIGEKVRLGSKEFEIKEIGKVEPLLSRAGFEELSKQPDNKAFILNSQEELSRFLARVHEAASSKAGLYLNGIHTGCGTVYLGVETGAALSGESRRLEFVGEAIINPNYPYRKNLVSRNTPITKEDRFLLSYNSIIALSFLELPSNVVRDIRWKCVLSSSTAVKLKKDIQILLEDSYRSAGRLGFDGDRPIFFESNDETRQWLRERWLPLFELIDGFDTVEPSAGISQTSFLGLPFENERIDIQTAIANELVFVTEDIVESQVCDSLDIRRCGIAPMLIRVGHPDYVFKEYVKKMADWKAEPPLENDLVESFKEAYLTVINRSDSGEAYDEQSAEVGDGGNDLVE